MKIFNPLETTENAIVTFSDADRLEAAFPRYDLRFFLNKNGFMECYELCKVVDPDQTLGTLIGLESRLILRGTCEHSGRLDRLLLVPEGKITVCLLSNHVQVRIDSDAARVRLFQYKLDDCLRRLRGTGDIYESLFKAYLQAVTSNVLQDPFTGRTGTEEALACLRQKSMCFSRPLNAEELLMLELISKLTPRRSYYPQHLQVMQTVKWCPNLTALVQHDEFLPLAERILCSSNSCRPFYPEFSESPTLYPKVERHLQTRARLRNSVYFSSDLGGLTCRHPHDVDYRGRDQDTMDDRANRVIEIADLVIAWPTHLKVSQNLFNELLAMNGLSGFGSIFDTKTSISDLLTTSFKLSWGPLHQLCRRSSRSSDTYALLFTFATIAYGKHATTALLRPLLAFAFESKLRQETTPPSHSTYDLDKGTTLNVSLLEQLLKQHLSPFRTSRRTLTSEQVRIEKEAHKIYGTREVKSAVAFFQNQWPCLNPRPTNRGDYPHIRMEHAGPKVIALLVKCTKNRELQEYIEHVQKLTQGFQPMFDTVASLHSHWPPPQTILEPRFSAVLPTMESLFDIIPPLLVVNPEPQILVSIRASKPPAENLKLWELVRSLPSRSGKDEIELTRKLYVDDLQRSLATFNQSEVPFTPAELPFSVQDMVRNVSGRQDQVQHIFQSIEYAFREGRTTSTLLEIGEYWPRVTIPILLARLSTVSSHKLSPAWLVCLTELGIAVTMLQRARRLLSAAERGDVAGCWAEAENDGLKGWNPLEWPDWLLVEIENDFLIRPIQAKVALEMINPASGANSLIQLNMGEGKSSVIVLLVAVAIADGTRVSRVVVLKSLVKQMADTISQRLSGLLDRSTYFMPFSRKVRINEDTVSQIQDLYGQCMRDRGILLAQPEHILSFKLMGIERLVSRDFGAASRLLQTQEWLTDHARDVLDESDEILDVKFQLIYTLGAQRMMDGQPDRWLLIQALFDLVEKHAMILQHTEGIEVHRRSTGSFPTIRLHSSNVSELLINKVLEDVLEGHLPGLSFERLSKDRQLRVLHFIQYETGTADVRNIDERHPDQGWFDQGLLKKNLLLMRGMFAHKVLHFVLQSKRWMVNYGLHPTRCLTAVPYRAKGVPAPSAEFGHPEVAIALTCLSYYYTGLSHSQLRTSFELLQKSDDPSLEYERWIRGCTELAPKFRSWNAVNLEDEQLFAEKLFPALRYNKKAADYYMAKVVFPKEGKEFDEKLSSSGWDIPSQGKPPTTGFSGTNDNRFLLPLSIVQRDLPQLHHTSGKVLNYVLHESNLRYHCAQDEKGHQLSGKGLIKLLNSLDPTVRVLIDVGAQVLDIENCDLVADWMTVAGAADIDAGIFFDKDDNVMVLSRDHKLEKLAVSSFQNRMDRCVVYLDEVHTRGTDLKFPATARAAVTLGPRLTKDRLVQACMRLRKLAQGQTLMYLAPPEVHQDILATTGKSGGRLDGYDVVAWCLVQSCLSIERSQPLRVMQGLNHHRRQLAMKNFRASIGKLREPLGATASLWEAFADRFREKEEQTLDDLYGPKSAAKDIFGDLQDSEEIRQLRAIWKSLDPSTASIASMREEHEREVAVEVEQESQIQRPPKAEPLNPAVDERLIRFVHAGSLGSFEPFAKVFDHTSSCSSAKEPEAVLVWSNVRATRDYLNTVVHPTNGFCDHYFRPANWVLTSKHETYATALLLISQYEVNELLNEIHSPSSHVNLHIYEPRVTKSMRSVDNARGGSQVKSRSVQNWQTLSGGLRQELNSFAGQLYFNSYLDYRAYLEDLERRTGGSVDKVLEFIKAWTAIRRKGHNFLQTHVGQMVSMRTLKEEAFE